MKKPISLPPLLFIILVNQLLIPNMAVTIGLTMFASDRFGASQTQVGTLGGLFFLAYGVTAYAGGLIAERFPKRRLMTTGLFLAGLIFFLIPFSRSLVHLYLVVALNSVIQVLIFPAHFSLIGDSVSPRRVARVLGINGLTLVMFGLIGAFAVGRIYKHLGPQPLFFAAGTYFLALAVFTALCAPNPDPDSPAMAPLDTSTDSAKPLPLHKNAMAFLRLALSLNALGFFVAVTHQTLLVKFAELPEFQLSFPDQSNVQSLRFFGAMTGYGIFALWPGWQWKTWPLGLLVTWLAAISLLAGFAPNAVILTIAIGLGGVATAACNQMSLFYSIGGGAVARGRGAGLNETALAVGGGLGPILGGLAANLTGNPRAALFLPLVPIAIVGLLWAGPFKIKE